MTTNANRITRMNVILKLFTGLKTSAVGSVMTRDHSGPLNLLPKKTGTLLRRSSLIIWPKII